MRIIAPLIILSITLYVALTGAHFCPDELNACIQVWTFTCHGIFSHIGAFFSLPRMWGALAFRS